MKAEELGIVPCPYCGTDDVNLTETDGDVLGSLKCLACGYEVEITKGDFIGEDVKTDLCEVWNDLAQNDVLKDMNFD